MCLLIDLERCHTRFANLHVETTTKNDTDVVDFCHHRALASEWGRSSWKSTRGHLASGSRQTLPRLRRARPPGSEASSGAPLSRAPIRRSDAATCKGEGGTKKQGEWAANSLEPGCSQYRRVRAESLTPRGAPATRYPEGGLLREKG